MVLTSATLRSYLPLPSRYLGQQNHSPRPRKMTATATTPIHGRCLIPPSSADYPQIKPSASLNVDEAARFVDGVNAGCDGLMRRRQASMRTTDIAILLVPRLRLGMHTGCEAPPRLPWAASLSG